MCPKCKETFDKPFKVKLPKLHCLRCKHDWIPKQETVIICPKCKSPYWNIESKNKEKKSDKK